tara:strand:- start:184 stop:315 length:132 start_codon:yes stop_codon:yes gene_type:complete
MGDKSPKSKDKGLKQKKVQDAKDKKKKKDNTQATTSIPVPKKK